MKKLLFVSIVFTATHIFSQGTVLFDNRNIFGTTHVWGPSSAVPYLSLQGFGLNDTPSGTLDFAGAGMSLIGANGSGGPFGYATTFTQLLAAPGSDMPESSLTPQGVTSTFRSGVAAGFIAFNGGTILQNVPKDAPWATIEVVAWDNSSGLYPTWTQAQAAWYSLQITAGKSGAFNVANIGGDLNTPPFFLVPSFNLSYVWLPEPPTSALAGLGVAASLVFRRRRKSDR